MPFPVPNRFTGGLLFVCLGFAAMWIAGCNPADTANGGAPSREPYNGRWVRPDGGYILEIAHAGTSPEAAYFNPSPISVGSAAFQPAASGSSEELVVVLQDHGYPGATYRLTHSAEADQLLGTYHQPASGQTFNVRFVRRDL